jgi:hypothetical protein
MSKSNHPIPVIDSIHLHSIYSPLREADTFTKSNEKKIDENNKLIIFGLGFGYHISALEQRLKSHYDDYEIIVIEPNSDLVTLWKEYKPTTFSTRVRIVNYSNLKSFFEDRLLIDFMVSKPSIISHTPSFQLNEEFFRQFMGYSYPSSSRSSSHFVHNSDYKNYLDEKDHQTTEELVKDINKKKRLGKWDFLTLAINQIRKQD